MGFAYLVMLKSFYDDFGEELVLIITFIIRTQYDYKYSMNRDAR